MTKKDLASKLSNQTGLTMTKAVEVVNAIFDTRKGVGIIANELDAGEKVSLAGFGTFSTRKTKERIGRNPVTGASITIQSRHVPVFRSGKGLRDKVYD